MKAPIMLAAILLFAGVSRAQYAEQRPAPPPSARPEAHSGGGRHFEGYDNDGPFLTVPLEISASPSGTSGAPPSGSAYTYGHGDASWQPSRFVAPRNTSGSQGNQSSTSQQRPANVSDQIRQLFQQKNFSGSSASGAGTQVLHPQISLGDVARQVRSERAAAEKPRAVIKQDGNGKAVLVEKPRAAANSSK
jgi:hypothetical protein